MPAQAPPVQQHKCTRLAETIGCTQAFIHDGLSGPPQTLCAGRATTAVVPLVLTTVLPPTCRLNTWWSSTQALQLVPNKGKHGPLSAVVS